MIYVECKPDEILVRSLGIARRRVVHGGNGKFDLCWRISKQTNSEGLIDEDPSARQPPYLARLAVNQELPDMGLKVLHDSARNNHIVMLCPTLEHWILKAAADVDVDPARHNLPGDAVALHRVINLDLAKFERLLGTLRKSGRLVTLRRIFRP